jgi:hypothetical protein
MKRRPLPIPQHEFGFTPDTFNLTAEQGLDGERIARELAQAEAARRAAERQQRPLFDFHEADCGGVFDGFSVTSDADSGL